MIKQVYYPYYEWEDYINGMYDIPLKPYDVEKVKLCSDLLSNQKEFYTVGLRVLDNWVKASHHNLSNVKINRQAWMGQAACCYKYKAEELVTREAWKLVNPFYQIEANKTANKLIGLYEEKNRALYPNLERKGLF